MNRKISLTTRLTILFTLISAGVLLGLGWVLAREAERHFEDLDRAMLQDELHLIREEMATADSLDALQQRLGDVLHSQSDFSALVTVDGLEVYTSVGLILPSSSKDQMASLKPRGMVTWTEKGFTYRGLFEEIAMPNLAARPVHVWIALNIEHHIHYMKDFRKTVGFYVVLATLFSGLLGWFAACRGLRPLRAMSDRAQVITARNLNERMAVHAMPPEVSDLAQTLNRMLERLQFDFQRLSEFSSDLAHELRTPISNMLMETQVALNQQRTVDEYQDILASNSEELQRLGRIVSDMLYLATTEHGVDLPHREAIQVDDEVRALFDFYDVLADEKHIALGMSGQVQISGDRLMVRRALSNLLSNALRHTPAGGSIRVTMEQTTGATLVHVLNTGSVISPDLMPRLFDRFFRADLARRRPESEGAGLGLAITQAIMRAHGGEALVSSGESCVRFTLRFTHHRHSGVH